MIFPREPSPITGHLALAALSAGVAYAVFNKGGAHSFDWYVALLIAAVGALLFWLIRSRRPLAQPPLDIWLGTLIVALPLYALVQLVPLPSAVLAVVSPARAELLHALAPIAPVHWAPLSTAPPATLAWFFRILAYLVILLTIREIAWRSERPWLVVAPLILIGTLEALLGMTQIAAAWPDGMARGTYVNRDHFAGLLEMLLPFAAMYAVAVWRRTNTRFQSPALPALAAAALGSFAALFLLGIIYSLSRMGFMTALCSLAVVVILAVGPPLPSRRLRLASLGVVVLAVLLAFVFLPPDQLIARFAQMASNDAVSADSRLDFWRETLSLIRAYPLFGCGLGTYESAFRPFQAVLPTLGITFAHNDYLQFFAELGIFGFPILALLVAVLAFRAVRATLEEKTVDGRCLAIACVGAIVAMLLHSFVDFNMQLPANAAVMAWIFGVATSLRTRSYGIE